jgi:hypothetical protein
VSDKRSCSAINAATGSPNLVLLHEGMSGQLDQTTRWRRFA